MLTAAQRETIENRVRHFIDRANDFYGLCMEYPIVDFKQGGTIAGTAYRDHTVDFNPVLLAENFDHFMNDTVPHEVAHLVDYHIHGFQYKRTRTGRKQRISHGEEWKKIMRSFGVDPERCHRLDVSSVRRPKTKYAYVCSHCGTELAVGPTYHKKIQRGVTGIRHKSCPGSHLEYKGVYGKVSYKEAQKMTPSEAPKPKTRTASKPKSGTQISQAVEILKMAYSKGINTRQGVIKIIQIEMNLDLQKASGLHDRAKKRVGA